MTALFEKWVGERTPIFLGTNHLSQELPFSCWYRFKESFSPEIIQQAFVEHPTKVQFCLDPFSGSGTTALTSQFLGVESQSYEVNPFLTDLGKSKVETYDLEALHSAWSKLIINMSYQASAQVDRKEVWLPPTFVQPGKNEKWLFSQSVAEAVFQLREAISHLTDPSAKRLFRVALGASLIENSNVIINGKGRRYRKNWQIRNRNREDLLQGFQFRLQNCLKDIELFGAKSNTPSAVENRDIRDPELELPEYDVSVFSPPYPNSFDYTDVYNVELWMLGYLRNRHDNTLLRNRTLTSHVQVSRQFLSLSNPPEKLTETLEQILEVQKKLWDVRIPKMLETYFFEMSGLLQKLYLSKKVGGRAWIIVGNSQYAGVDVETGQILSEIARDIGFKVLRNEVIRKMRTSPQQGGTPRLGENILVLA